MYKHVDILGSADNEPSKEEWEALLRSLAGCTHEQRVQSIANHLHLKTENLMEAVPESFLPYAQSLNEITNSVFALLSGRAESGESIPHIQILRFAALIYIFQVLLYSDQIDYRRVAYITTLSYVLEMSAPIGQINPKEAQVFSTWGQLPIPPDIFFDNHRLNAELKMLSRGLGHAAEIQLVELQKIVTYYLAPESIYELLEYIFTGSLKKDMQLQGIPQSIQRNADILVNAFGQAFSDQSVSEV